MRLGYIAVLAVATLLASAEALPSTAESKAAKTSKTATPNVWARSLETTVEDAPKRSLRSHKSITEERALPGGLNIADDIAKLSDDVAKVGKISSDAAKALKLSDEGLKIVQKYAPLYTSKLKRQVYFRWWLASGKKPYQVADMLQVPVLGAHPLKELVEKYRKFYNSVT